MVQPFYPPLIDVNPSPYGSNESRNILPPYREVHHIIDVG